MIESQQTPLREAMSLVVIVAILAAVGAYVGATYSFPGVSDLVLWISTMMFSAFPALTVFNNSPAFVGCATIGTTFFVCGMPLAQLIAMNLARTQVANIERNTRRLKRNRKAIQKKERAKYDFIVH
jgi:hypothetical protein